MSAFHLDGEVAGIATPTAFVPVPQMLVDTDSEFTWIPESILKQAGVTVAKQNQPFVMANGATVFRPTGYALLRASGFETVDEIVFGQPGDLALLGARTLEGFGAVVDASHRRLAAAGPHLAASVGCVKQSTRNAETALERLRQKHASNGLGADAPRRGVDSSSAVRLASRASAD